MPNPPRVCHVVLSLALGGLERLVVEFTNARNRQDPASTMIACLDEPGALAAEVEGDAVISLSADRARFPVDTRALRALRQHWRGTAGVAPITVVHSHNLAAHQYAVLGRWGLALGHVHTEHGSNPHVAGMGNRLRLRALARRTSALVAVSADTARHMGAAWGVPADRVQVVPNGVTPHVAATPGVVNALRTELKIPMGAPVIGTVGRLAHVKGYDRLLAAMPALLTRIPDVCWVLVGDGAERGALQTQAEQLGVSRAVRFAGARQVARTFYELFDLYVAPSRSEGLPVALLEAMAAGCPVLVTDTGEQRAVLDNGRVGSLLGADERAWPVQIAGCLGGTGRAAACERGAAAVERVRTHYGLAQTLTAYEALYGAVAPSFP